MVDAHAHQHGMLCFHLINVAVVRKACAQSVRWLCRATSADTVRQDYIEPLSVQRLIGLEQVVGERGCQEGFASLGSAMQKNDCVNNLARSVPLRRAECGIVQLQDRQVLTVLQGEVMYRYVCLLRLRFICTVGERWRQQSD